MSTPNVPKEIAIQIITAQAKQLIANAETFGLVVTIETKPLQPLAMGNYEMVAEVRTKEQGQ